MNDETLVKSIEARRDELKIALDQIAQNIDSLVANKFATMGAIQEFEKILEAMQPKDGDAKD